MHATLSGGKVLGQHLLTICKVPPAASRPRQRPQIRQLAWVPQAYRRTRNRTPPRNRHGKNNGETSYSSFRSRTPTRRRRKNGNTRHEATKHVATSSEEILDSRIQWQKDRFIDLQKDLDQRLQRFQQILGQDLDRSPEVEGQRNQKQDSLTRQQVTGFVSNISGLHGHGTPYSWEDIEKTEAGYRGICNVVTDMIAASSKIQALVMRQVSEERRKSQERRNDPETSFYSHVAEHLLLSLIDLQFNRREFVEAIPPVGQGENERQSWLEWIKDKVVSSPEQAVSKKDTTIGLLAHEDPICGPRLEHLQNVSSVMLKTLREELLCDPKMSFRKIGRAERLQRLVEKMPSNVEPDVSCIKNLMNAYAFVGSYESAIACKKVYDKYPSMQEETFGVLLHAFFLAAKFSPRNQERSRAATNAEELVREKWESNTNGPDQYEEKRFVHCAKALLCLHATGADAIPDMCNRADSLVDVCIGRDNFEELFRNENLEGLWKIAPANLTLPLLNCLVLIYSASGDTSRIKLGKKLLKILLEDPDFKADRDIPYPDLRTCKAVVNALVGMDDRKNRWMRATSRRNNGSKGAGGIDSSRENFDFGVEILDLMFARSPCWPDQSFFHSLFRVLLIARPKDSGSLSENVLSRMHVRQCFEKSDLSTVNRKTYHYVLRCWLASAESGHPEAAQRAVELLEMMEAQSLPLMTSMATSRDSGGSQVYNTAITPDRSTYQLVMKICSAIKPYPEKENALDIALAVDKKMKERGILPSSDTYALLFSCCENLLPDHSTRRQKVTAQLLEDARNEGNVKESVLQQLKNAGRDNDASDADDDHSDRSGAGGLLAGL